MMFPWVKIPLHARTTREDFLDWLRYRAIDWGMPTSFIDCVDDLRANGDKQTEIDSLNEELEVVENERDALRDALKSLLVDPEDQARIEVAQGVLDDLRP